MSVPKKRIADEVKAVEVPYLRKRISELNRELTREKERTGELRQFHESVLSTVVAAQPRKPWTLDVRPGRPTAAAAFMYSDWHCGERIKKNEVEGFNEFNWRIAQEGMRGIVADQLQWIETQRKGYNISEAHIMGLGDFISGDIHEELRATNEFPTPVQSANAGLLFGETVAAISERFERVYVYEIGADNHGRLNKKPQAKQKSENNFNYTVYAIANAHLRDISHVSVIQADGSKLIATINGWRFLMEHGDNVKSQMGIPFYGFNRALGREALRRMNDGRGFDFWCIGHFHVPTVLEWRTIVNGSLTGTSEYDHQAGRHAAPSQVAFLVHGKHGVFNVTPFRRKS